MDEPNQGESPPLWPLWPFLSPIREPWSELDLGIIREDPPLATNNFTVFAEQWENVRGLCQNGTSDCRVLGVHLCGDGWLYADGGTLDLGIIRDSPCRCRWAITRALHRCWSLLRYGRAPSITMDATFTTFIE